MPKYDSQNPEFFSQQIMLIGTYDEDGKARFCPISWVSYTWGPPPCLVVSVWGTKQTKKNITRTGIFSATLVTPELLPLCEQFNRNTYKKELFDQLQYTIKEGTKLKVPLLKDTLYSIECKVLTTTEIGKIITYFGEIHHINMTEDLEEMEFFDLTKINPVIYSPDKHYYTIGEYIGEIGDYSK